jgi:hypothetical protein
MCHDIRMSGFCIPSYCYQEVRRRWTMYSPTHLSHLPFLMNLTFISTF